MGSPRRTTQKEERESARLADFDFELRVRTYRLLARVLGAEEAQLVRLVAQGDDQAALLEVGSAYGMSEVTLRQTSLRCRDDARDQLIAEFGSPTSFRLL